MKLHMLAFFLVIVGALNWGLVGMFNYNLVSVLFGGSPMIEQWVYILVGLSAVYIAVGHKNDCMLCSDKKKK